ncbi:MAG: lipopolysaccharide biosynthesis protein [Deltaproteobacteria bacterium]|nr:lipopolysaccharide biosynthesis protein [Deltaproteobacteria bacterium]
MSETLDSKMIKGIVRRRYRVFLISFLIIVVAGCLTSILLPPKYLSTSVILIENQMIPQEYVQTTITSFVEERLASITQQVMSRSRLMEIIENFDLYRDMREKYTSEEIIEKMRADIHFEPKTAEVIDRRTGRPTEATIYFTLSYEGDDPVKVQKVANVLASLYLELNLKTRERLASNTTVFLENELERLKQETEAYEEKVSIFKAEHIGALPEYNAGNMQSMYQVEAQIERLNAQINALKDRKILLEGQLSVTDPLLLIQTSDGKSMMNPGDRLNFLRMELISMGSRLSTQHPDYIKLKGEITELEKHTGSAGDLKENIKRLEALKTELKEAEGNKGAEHPDVIRLKRELETLSKQIEEADQEKELKERRLSLEPDNPAYINLMTQIASTDNEIKGFGEQIRILAAQAESFKKMIASTPVIEREYNKLIMESALSKEKYAEINSKLMEAKVAQGMETTQRGERFTIIDSAQLPEKPDSPNRLAIALISFILALGAGTGMAAIKESMDDSVKSSEELGRLTGFPVLSTINRITTDDDMQANRKKRIIWSVSIVVLLILGAIAFHNLVMPVEVFEAKLSRKIERL